MASFSFIFATFFCFAAGEEVAIRNKTEASKTVPNAISSRIINPTKPDPGIRVTDECIVPPPSPYLTNLKNRNALTLQNMLWPNGQIFYKLSPEIAAKPEAVEAIRQAIADYHNYSCIRFKERTNEPNYVTVIFGNGCYSPVGLQSTGSQDLSLGDGCHIKATVIHEFMHALGFDHEQNRADRDNFVTIRMENVVSGKGNNFEKSSAQFSTNGFSYDYSSVMHYGKYFFSIDSAHTDPNKMTIVPKDPAADIGQRYGFSENDLKKLNQLYKCDTSKNAVYAGKPFQQGLITSFAFNQSTIDAILTKVNNARKAVPGGAANMKQMTWSENLAAAAKAQVEKCQWAAIPAGVCNRVGSGRSYFSSVYIDPIVLMGTYIDGIVTSGAKYTAAADNCGADGTCYGYRQLVWSQTWQMGCGLALCGGMDGTDVGKDTEVYNVYCLYGPPGNIGGIKPYKTGAACSQCSTGCTGGMCNPPAQNECGDARDPNQCNSNINTFKQHPMYQPKGIDICARCNNRWYTSMMNYCMNSCNLCEVY